jgi:Bifunctional DNA primase/polymerase, N-terminal
VNSVLAAALQLAAEGRPVFPCAVSTKCPATPHGFKDACTDSAMIEKLWRDHPGGLIGVPTGADSGIDALDLDAKHEEAKTWWHDNRHRLPRTRTHKTRSGGLHLLFQHDDTMRCSAGKIVLGVDTRAAGGRKSGTKVLRLGKGTALRRLK